jgi:hypothetical protein
MANINNFEIQHVEIKDLFSKIKEEDVLFTKI